MRLLGIFLLYNLTECLSAIRLNNISNFTQSYTNIAKNTIRLLFNNKNVEKCTTDANYRKQFARSKLARGSALSKGCNSRCAAKTPCNERCQQARDRYQLRGNPRSSESAKLIPAPMTPSRPSGITIPYKFL